MIRHQLQKQIDFTYQEKMIADYILEHPRCVLEYNAREFAERVYTSPSTIIRFCKKLGFSGFPSFQRQYSYEYSLREQFSEKVILDNVTSQNVCHVLENMYHYVFQETNLSLDQEALNKIVSLLLNKEKIILYGTQFNYLMLQSFALNLSSINKMTQVFNDSNNFHLDSLDPNENVVIISSHSGHNPQMVRIASELKKRNITTIAITNPIDHTLEKLCDYHLYLFSADENSRIGFLQWPISLNYILQILYICMLENYKKQKEINL